MMYSLGGQSSVSPAKRRDFRGSARVWWPVILATTLAACVVAASALMVVHVFTDRPPPVVRVPAGLVVTAQTDHVQLAWKASPHAESYLVQRDGQVVYSGPATDFADYSASAGSHGYSVAAAGPQRRISPPSAIVDVIAAPSWGDSAPLVRSLGDMLPATPDSTGFDRMRCVVRHASMSGEMVNDPATSLRLACAASVSGRGPLGVYVDFWTDTAQRDRGIRSFGPAARKFRWAGGRGRLIGPATIAVLEFDRTEHSLVTVSLIPEGNSPWPASALIGYANHLPV